VPAALLISLLAAAFAGILLRRTAPYAGWIAAIVPAALFCYFAAAGTAISGAGAVVEEALWVPSIGVSFALRLDGLSWLFTLIITGIGTLVTIYSGAYFADAPPLAASRFLRLILLFMCAMLGAVLADDLIVLFLFWEATSLLSFMLIGFHSERTEARKAALQSLLVTAGGGLALFAGILLLAIDVGTFSLSGMAAHRAELAASPVAVPAMALIVAGAFAKSAQVPFHFWLPAAMEAPTPASAFLHSATMVKLGVYLLARFDQVFAAIPGFAATLVVAGSATMLVATVRAFAADGYKAVLAQSTVASLGLLVLLVGLDGEYAAAATVTFIVAHALYKAALFFCAGTAIHLTHEGRLSRLGGLRHALPGTAAAAGLAAVSMAGLFPTFSFISKETMLEAQLTAAGFYALAVSLLVNAAFVAIAGATGVRPYFGARREGADVHGHETAGLVLGPLALGVLGLVFGLAPAATVGRVVDTAVSALLGRPAAVSLALWHGWTPALAISGVVFAGGVALLFSWNAIHARLTRAPWLDRMLGDAGYERLHDGLLALAGRTTRLLQNGDQHRYTSVVLWFVVALTAIALAAAGGGLTLALDAGELHAGAAVVLLLMASGAIAAARTGSLLVAVIAIGVIGFGSALIYVMNGAPDLALTQFSVEVLVVLILTALLLRIPPSLGTRSRGEKRRDAMAAAAVGAIVFVALTSMAAVPLDTTLTDYFGRTSYTEAHGRNVVNVIIVDYRGLDTLGEISVVAFATTAVWGLLRRRRAGGP
jgi:multicomponent Na+:H+ antiporter subunit A